MLRRVSNSISAGSSALLRLCCTSSVGGSSMCIAAVSSPASSLRFLQFKRTDDMFKAANSRKGTVREEWVSNSTADFEERLKIAEHQGIDVRADKVRPNVSTLMDAPQPRRATPMTMTATAHQRFQTTSTAELAKQREAREDSLSRRDKADREAKLKNETQESIAQHRDEFDRSSAEHWDRIKTFKAARSGRYKQFFAQWGWGFFSWYLVIYVLGLLGIFAAIKWKYIDHRSAFEYVYCLTFGAIDRPKFFDTLDGTAPWLVDAAFALMINEMLDFWRLPFAAFTFWSIRFWWMRSPGKTMFRDTMPEKAIEFTIKQRDAARREVMKRSGGTAATAAVAPNVGETPEALKAANLTKL